MIVISFYIARKVLSEIPRIILRLRHGHRRYRIRIRYESNQTPEDKDQTVQRLQLRILQQGEEAHKVRDQEDDIRTLSEEEQLLIKNY